MFRNLTQRHSPDHRPAKSMNGENRSQYRYINTVIINIYLKTSIRCAISVTEKEKKFPPKKQKAKIMASFHTRAAGIKIFEYNSKIKKTNSYSNAEITTVDLFVLIYFLPSLILTLPVLVSSSPACWNKPPFFSHDKPTNEHCRPQIRSDI